MTKEALDGRIYFRTTRRTEIATQIIAACLSRPGSENSDIFYANTDNVNWAFQIANDILDMELIWEETDSKVQAWKAERLKQIEAEKNIPDIFPAT